MSNATGARNAQDSMVVDDQPSMTAGQNSSFAEGQRQSQMPFGAGLASTLSSDRVAGAMVHVEANEAPVLRSTDTYEILNWLEKYRVYILRVEDACRASVGHIPGSRSVASMIDPPLLQMIGKWHLMNS